MSQTHKQRRSEALGRPERSGQSRGFTLIELLVVLAIIAILMAVFAPSMIGIKDRLRQVNCASNEKQLMMGWRMWSTDNGGKLPLASNSGVNSFTRNNEFGNTTSSATQGCVFPYLKELSLYKCPAAWFDYCVTYTIGWGINGEWFPETDWGGKDPARTRKGPSTMSAIQNPAGTSVLLEEFDVRGYNEGSMCVKLRGSGYFDTTYDQWNDTPAANHLAGFDQVYIGGGLGAARGDNLSFADGHVEFWVWKTQASVTPGHPNGDYSGNVDLVRLHGVFYPW